MVVGASAVVVVVVAGVVKAVVSDVVGSSSGQVAIGFSLHESSSQQAETQDLKLEVLQLLIGQYV